MRKESCSTSSSQEKKTKSNRKISGAALYKLVRSYAFLIIAILTFVLALIDIDMATNILQVLEKIFLITP